MYNSFCLSEDLYSQCHIFFVLLLPLLSFLCLCLYVLFSYVYFDYESGWCQRLKADFTFEYRHLENELPDPVLDGPTLSPPPRHTLPMGPTAAANSAAGGRTDTVRASITGDFYRQ